MNLVIGSKFPRKTGENAVSLFLSLFLFHAPHLILTPSSQLGAKYLPMNPEDYEFLETWRTFFMFPGIRDSKKIVHVIVLNSKYLLIRWGITPPSLPYVPSKVILETLIQLSKLLLQLNILFNSLWFLPGNL